MVVCCFATRLNTQEKFGDRGGLAFGPPGAFGPPEGGPFGAEGAFGPVAATLEPLADMPGYARRAFRTHRQTDGQSWGNICIIYIGYICKILNKEIIQIERLFIDNAEIRAENRSIAYSE